MKEILLAPLFALSYIGFLAMRTILILIGWIVVPLAVLCRAYEVRPSRIYSDGRMVRAFTWKYIWLWGNEEEGIGWYGDYDSLAMKIIYSECFRNPVNNLRYVPFFSLKIDPEGVKFVGSLGSHKDNLERHIVEKYDSDDEVFWSLTYQGLYSNIRVHFMFRNVRYRFWLGWKIYPEDIYGLPSWDHRRATAGFATQLKKIGE